MAWRGPASRGVGRGCGILGGALTISNSLTIPTPTSPAQLIRLPFISFLLVLYVRRTAVQVYYLVIIPYLTCTNGQYRYRSVSLILTSAIRTRNGGGPPAQRSAR